jgi:hypothetical protein
MPRRKKFPTVPDYMNGGKSRTDLIVQKSNPLQSLSETSMTLTEFKILDVYLSRINSHEPKKRYVKFDRGEFEKLLGVTKIPIPEMNKRLDNLFQTITVRDESRPKGFRKIALFEYADFYANDDGLWTVELACTLSAMEYIFNIDNIGYLRYRLKNVIELTSRYSYVMYLYLEQNHFRKSWEISLSELKKILNCTAERYTQYKFFNSEILKKCQKELQEKTTLNFSYEPIKQGRKVTKIKFTVETLSDDISSIEEQLFLFSPTEEKESEIEYGSELANLLGSSACNDEFTVEQIRVLQDLVLKAIPSSDYIELCDYVSHKVHKMNLYDSRTKIKDRFAYLCKMIEKDL